MDNRDRNIFDKFLDGYDKYSSKKVEYRRVYVRPSKFKSIFYFIFSLVFFIILLTIFSFNLMYFTLFFGDLAVLIFNGINVFSKKGIGLPKTVAVPVHEEDEVDKEKVQ